MKLSQDKSSIGSRQQHNEKSTNESIKYKKIYGNTITNNINTKQKEIW